MTISADKEKIIKKIQHILNKTTEKGATEEEAQSAMLMAQKLMAKYGLEMTDIEITTTDKETKKEIVEGEATDSIKLAWWHKSLAKIIADNFRCRHFYYKSYGGYYQVVFFGFKEDVEIAKMVYKFASIQIEYHARQYRRKRKKELEKKFLPENFKNMSFDELATFATSRCNISLWKIDRIYKKYDNEATRKKYLTLAIKEALGINIGTAVRNDYIRGFLKGLDEKFKEQIEQNKEEWGLVLVRDKAIDEAFANIQSTEKMRPSKVSTSYDFKAYEDGRQQGKRFEQVSGEIEG